MEEKLIKQKKILEDIEMSEYIMRLANTVSFNSNRFSLIVKAWPEDKILYLSNSLIKKVIKNTISELYEELRELQ
ncbi:hypothetical protein [Faecalicoccus sp.]|uniref:hypothetical protein n=1 Tax=Faecalicoccus sp. TaxID=1971758 RepID=UPI0026228116|nr:hypothetical protein [Faecalicoccus sp.]